MHHREPKVPSPLNDKLGRRDSHWAAEPICAQLGSRVKNFRPGSLTSHSWDQDCGQAWVTLVSHQLETP